MLPELIKTILSGILAAVVVMFPTSTRVVLYRPTDLLVPSYAGVIVAILFYFRDVVSREPVLAIKGYPWPQLKYLTLTTALTLTIGLLLPELSLSPTAIATVGIIIALSLPLAQRYPFLYRLRASFEEEPTPLDAITTGLAQVVSVLFFLPRSGLVALSLAFSGYDAKRILRFSLEAAPAYALVQVLKLGQCQFIPKWIGPVAFASGFFSTLLLTWTLFKLTESLETRWFLAFYGVIGALIQILGVLN